MNGSDDAKRLQLQVRFYEAQARVMEQSGRHSPAALEQARLLVARARGRLEGEALLVEVRCA